MRCWVVVLVSAFAFALAAPLGLEAAAAKKYRVCTATGVDGKQIKWKCNARQMCCNSWLFARGTSIRGSQICL
jgi:hypothetical protein